jgi:hypothetical protein
MDPNDLEWKPGSVRKDGSKAMLMAYMNARAIMDRLDEAVGPDNWWDSYEAGPSGGVVCHLTIRTEHGPVTKTDGAENTDFEPVKGGISNALKRAASRWGIGRYLYWLDTGWSQVLTGYPEWGTPYVNITKDKKRIGYCLTPVLPEWAVPGGSGRPGKRAAPAKRKKAAPKQDAGVSKAAKLARDQTAAIWRLLRSHGVVKKADANAMITKASDGVLSIAAVDHEPGEVLAVLNTHFDQQASTEGPEQINM